LRPPEVSIEAWRDETLEAVAQLSVPHIERRPSWNILFITLAFFAVSLRFFTTWELTLIIIGILLLHECGHWFAMKALGFRDMQMFFIPFLGAAVSGKKDNASQVEHALHILAGPVPGILAGSAAVVLTATGLLSPPPVVLQLAWWLVLLNALQLLPLVPLDGGQFFNAILFSRWSWPKLLCEIIGAGAFLAVGIWRNSAVLSGIGVIAFFTLTTRYRISELSRKLRSMGLNRSPTLDAMSLTELVKSYTIARATVPVKASASPTRRVTERVYALQRAYPMTLARPAPPWAAGALAALYFAVVGCAAASYHYWPIAKIRIQPPALQNPAEDDAPGDNRIRMYDQ